MHHLPLTLSRRSGTRLPGAIAQASASALSSSPAASSPVASLGNSSSFLPKLVLVQTPDTHEYELWHTNPQDPANQSKLCETLLLLISPQEKNKMDAHPTALMHSNVMRGSPQLLLSLRVLVQRGLRMVPHLVVPPVHWKRQVPWLQMVIAEGSVGHTVPHVPLQQHAAICKHSSLYGLLQELQYQDARLTGRSAALPSHKLSSG